MSPRVDPRSNANVSVETINSTLLDRATDLLGFINGAIGFEGTGAKNFTIYQNGTLEDLTLAIHNIETNSDQPSWVEAQNILFQAAPYRLNQIKEKLEANIDSIKNDIAGNISNLFTMIQGKENEFNPLEGALSNALNFDDVIASGRNLENAILDFDKIARDIADIYFSNGLNGLDLKIEEEIFGLLGKAGGEYSNGSTNTPKYFFSFSRRDVSKSEIYERFTNEIKTAYEAQYGANSWTKENYLKKMFETKQIELSESTIKAILVDKNRNKNEFKKESEILALVTNFDDLLRIIGTNDANKTENIERLFKEHLTEYQIPTQLIDANDSASCIEQGIKQLEIFTRDNYGDSKWTEGLESFNLGSKNISINFSVLDTSLQNLIAGGKLKLEPDLIQTIIQEKNISSEDLRKFKTSADFLKLLTKEELYSIAGRHYSLSDNKSISLKLFEGNLKINTPIYYEDQRSVYDILAGKNNNNGDSNNINKIFTSLENQIKGLGETTKNLLSQGYDKAPRNNLQKYLRENPLEASIYLENYIANNSATLSENEKTNIVNNIKKMMGRFNLLVTEQMNVSNIADKDAITSLYDAVRNYNPIEGKNIASIKQKFDALSSGVKSKFDFEAWPENLREPTSENLSAVLAEISEDSKFFNTHKALYAAEMQEANKLNTQHLGQKLPEPRPDGSIPDIEQPIPPSIGPSLLSSVIASIGNQALNRANSIINGDHPDANWLTEQSSFLRKLDTDLQTLPSDTTRSQQFIEALKKTFIPIIKKFLENKSDTKLLADSAKNNLLNNNTNIKKINILNGTESGFDFGAGSLDSDLNQIEADLPELMNPSSININSNKICKAGLVDTKLFLETSARNLQELILNPPEGADLNDLQEKLSKVYNLLFGNNGNSSNPSNGSILERLTTYNRDIDSACSGKPDDMDRLNYLTSQQSSLINNYKEALINFSNDVTSAEDDDNFDIKQAFKDAIDNASSDFDGDGDLDPALDSDGNGVNDFQDLKNLANMISGGANSLANTLENVFGSKNDSNKHISNMGIRRLIMMMFLFTIFESSDWEYQRQEADMSRYQTW
jgi:hypothetical protein